MSRSLTLQEVPALKKIHLTILAATAIVVAAASPAYANPDKSSRCSGCHSGSSVAISATQTANNGTTATYNVVSAGDAWAVFSPTAKVTYGANGTGQFTVPVGKTYTVYSIQGPNENDGIGSTTVSPVAPPAEDLTAPVTTSDAAAWYNGAATVHFTGTDNAGGSGVASTYYALDGGAPVAGTSVVVSAIGTHTVEFWSADVAGNVEATHGSATFIVKAYLKPAVSKPYAPASIKKGKAWTTAGWLTPAHDSGLKLVKLSCYHKESGKWKLRKTVYATLGNATVGSKYAARFSLGYKGAWKIQASHKDAGHPTTLKSAWRYLTVK